MAEFGLCQGQVTTRTLGQPLPYGRGSDGCGGYGGSGEVRSSDVGCGDVGGIMNGSQVGSGEVIHG
jgi:hypothetical protein